MWIDAVLKCPDEGTWYKLISITDEGKVTTLKYLLSEEVEKIMDEK